MVACAAVVPFRHFTVLESCMTQGRNVTAEKHGCIKVRKNGRTKKKKKKTCNLCYNVTLLQNELINDVARFATHIKPVLRQIRFLAGLMWVVKRATSAIQFVSQQWCKTSRMFFCCPFFRQMMVIATTTMKMSNTNFPFD